MASNLTVTAAAALSRAVAVVVVVAVLVGVHVIGLVLDSVLEEGQILALDLSQGRRLLLSSVVVGVEVSHLNTELVLVGVGDLNVVLVGEQVPVVTLDGTEAESFTTLGQVGILVGVLGLGASKVLIRVRILIRVLADGGVIFLLPLVGAVVLRLVGVLRLRGIVRVVVLVCLRVGVVVVWVAVVVVAIVLLGVVILPIGVLRLVVLVARPIGLSV